MPTEEKLSEADQVHAWTTGYAFRLETRQQLIDLFDDGPVVVS